MHFRECCYTSPMQKNFDKWNESKKQIHLEAENKLYHKREIWWCMLGLNIGYEQDGTGDNESRPVLILKGFSKQVCVVLPLTTSDKKNPYHSPIGKIDGKEAWVIVSQIRLIDTKRLINKIGVLEKKLFEGIRKAAKDNL